MMAEKIVAIMIIEAAGKPVDFLTNSIKIHVDKLNALKDVKINYAKLAEPILADKDKEIYTTFAEVEVEVETMLRLTELIFDFMPSSVEIVEPSDIKIDCQEATVFMNYLAGRLHKYDEVAKVAQMQLHKMSEIIKSGQHVKNPSSAIQPVSLKMGSEEKPEEKKSTPKKKAVKKSKKK